MCKCKSYNMGFGEVPEVVIYPANPELAGGRDSVCVDACIAGCIEYLWGLGMPTLNSCCGHGKNMPSVVIPESYNPADYLDALADFDYRDWVVMRWELSGHKRSH